MASRLSLPRLPRIEIRVPTRERLEQRRRAIQRPTGPALWQMIWRFIWAPYWLGSDVPAPRLPTRDRKAPAGGLAGDQVAQTLDQIGRRIWIQWALTILARSAWLGLFVGCGWLIVELSGGPELDVSALTIVAIAVAIPGIILVALIRPARRQVARMLDRSFVLQERMSTAVENFGKSIPAHGERASVVYLQMADAANVVADLRQHSAFRIRPPVREIVLAIGCGLLMASLYFLRGVGGDIPDVSTEAVPKFVPAAERIVAEQAASAAQASDEAAPSIEEVQQRVQRSNEARRDLQTLARALDDHAVTRAAAEAIQQGDYDAAASELRDLSEQASELSPEAREGLAQDLEDAASKMSPGSEQLGEASQQAASGLRQGEQAAEEGVRELGEAVENTGGEVASQQELADQMAQAQAAENQGSSGEQSPSGSQEFGEQSFTESDQSQSGQSGDQSASEQGNQSSEGADAEPGAGDQPGQSDAAAPTGEEPPAGEAGQAEGEAGGQSESSGAQPGQQPGDPTGPEGAAPGQTGPEGGAPQAEGAQEGAGAGSASDEGIDGAQGQTQEGSDQGPSEGAPAEQNVSEGQAPEGAGSEATTDPRDAIQLARAPEGESVQTGGDGGSSSVGSGAGVTVSGGNSVQGEVGDAGPDSNRVPTSYQDIVKDYFSDPTDEP